MSYGTTILDGILPRSQVEVSTRTNIRFLGSRRPRSIAGCWCSLVGFEQWFQNRRYLPRNSLFLVEISGNTGRNAFLTSIASQKIFRSYFQKSRLECYFLCLFYFLSPYSGHLRSDFVVLLLLLTARSRRTWKADQKCPEKKDKKSKIDMKNNISKGLSRNILQKFKTAA